MLKDAQKKKIRKKCCKKCFGASGLAGAIEAEEEPMGERFPPQDVKPFRI